MNNTVYIQYNCVAHYRARIFELLSENKEFEFTIVADKDFKLNVQTLSNHGWKLQQDLPTKNYKNTDVGSQIQKNILAGIKDYLDNNNFTLNPF